MITLTAIPRKGKTKSELTQLRRTGFIPFVLYSKGVALEIGSVPAQEVEAALRSLRPGFLPTTIFTIKTAQGERKVIVKDIQYRPTSYEIIHLDFLELHADQKVELKVPVEFLNSVDCIGVKLGGFLRQVLRHIKVACLPKDIPSHFELDIKDLDIHQTRKVKDIAIPKGVHCLIQIEDVVVSVVKR